MSAQQLALFPPEEMEERAPAALVPGMSLSPQSYLSKATRPFQAFMAAQGFTENTIKSFLGDLRLLIRYLGPRTRLGEIHTQHLNAFLSWLARERGVPCSPKSYARRVTTLKVFFHWLKEEGVLRSDPAEAVVQLKAASPLPQILYESQVAEVLAVTRGLLLGEKPDARPHLLVTTVLTTGIKKSECMGIQLAHLDLSNRNAPILFVRYDNPRYRLKERKLRLPDDFCDTFEIYRERYQPKTHLFECTARNLEYVLRDVAVRAGLPNGLSFEMLRWTCAVRDYQRGLEPDLLRMKLGLSPISWAETLEKIRILAEPPL